MSLIEALLEHQGLRALILLSQSFRDPQMAPFLRGGHVGSSLMVAGAGREPRLGYLSPMERDEAAKSGMSLMTPGELDVHRLGRAGCQHDELLAGVLSRALHLCELSPGPVAIAGLMPAGLMRSVCGQLESEGWSFVPGESIADLYRKKKSKEQLTKIRQAAAGTMEAFRRVANMLAHSGIGEEGLSLEGGPLTVGRLRSEIAKVLAGHQLEQPDGNIVAPAEEGAAPHSIGTNSRRLKAGESLVVDIFPRGDLFADCTRTFCVGEPRGDLAKGYEIVLNALEKVEVSTQPGMRAWALQEQTCACFEEAGYPTPISHPGTERGYVHGLGHGVGYEVHELPSFREHLPAAEGCIEAGDVITLEPGLYEPEDGWAVRIEDLFEVTESGLLNLTPLPRKLDPRAW